MFGCGWVGTGGSPDTLDEALPAHRGRRSPIRDCGPNMTGGSHPWAFDNYWCLSVEDVTKRRTIYTELHYHINGIKITYNLRKVDFLP